MRKRSLTIVFALHIAMFTAIAAAQDKSANSWRFRFPDSSKQTGSEKELDDRRVNVASLPSTKEFKRPKIEVPPLAESQIVLPTKPRENTSVPSITSEPIASKAEPQSRDIRSAPNPLTDRSAVDEASSPSDRVAAATASASDAPSPPAPLDPYKTPAPVSRLAQLNPFTGGGDFLPMLRRRRNLWVRGEYLYWWAENLRTPPLITTNPTGTPQNEAGFLGGTGTQIAFGTGTTNNELQHGFRITSGFGLDTAGRFSLEGEYFRMLDRSTGIAFASDDLQTPSNIFGRPFFDLSAGQETAQLISLDGLTSGAISVNAESRLRSYGVYLRGATSPGPGPCDIIAINSPLTSGFGRFDLLLGYRHANLEDVISINENTNGLQAPNPPNPGNLGTFEISEAFHTDNNFQGVELGLVWYGSWRRFSTELVTKLAVGVNEQTVFISGFSDINEAGFLERFPGGILAQRSNIGEHRRTELSVLPQLNYTLGLQVTRNMRLRAGYNLFYMSNVVRAGDQIDTDINPNLFPPENPVVTDVLRPTFRFRETDYWAHGISAGADFWF